MIRAVVDTNVYVSVLVLGGKPAVVLQLAESGAFELVPPTEIRAELVATLAEKDTLMLTCQAWAPAGTLGAVRPESLRIVAEHWRKLNPRVAPTRNSTGKLTARPLKGLSQKAFSALGQSERIEVFLVNGCCLYMTSTSRLSGSM